MTPLSINGLDIRMFLDMVRVRKRRSPAPDRQFQDFVGFTPGILSPYE
jgi:hypothetical protein